MKPQGVAHIVYIGSTTRPLPLRLKEKMSSNLHLEPHARAHSAVLERVRFRERLLHWELRDYLLQKHLSRWAGTNLPVPAPPTDFKNGSFFVLDDELYKQVCEFVDQMEDVEY